MDEPRKPLDLTKVSPENRPALAALAALNERHRAWRDGTLVAVTANLTEAYLRREAMWGIKIKGRTVLTDYDNTPEARVEAAMRRTA